MKNIFLIAFSAIILAGCNAGSYTITGTMPDNESDGAWAYLSDYNADNQTIDSVLISEGKFVFEGKAEGNKLVRIDAASKYANIILEAGDITIDMSDPNSGAGTALNDANAEFQKKLNTYLETAQNTYASIAEDETLSEEVRQAKLEEFGTQAGKELNDICIEAFKANPDNAAGVYAFWKAVQNCDNADDFDTIYAMASERVKEFAPIQKSAKKYEAYRNTAEGEMFTDFTITGGNSDGSDAKLSDYVGKGKYVLVDFWASWCGPCRREIPVIAEVYEKYKGDSFDVLSIAVWDNREDSIKAIEELGMNWNQIIDAQNIPTDLYGIDGIPHIILFAPDGTIAARNLRGDSLRKAVADAVAK